MRALGLAAALLSSGVAASPDAPRYLGPKPPAEVRRVVTLAPSLTETVVALGAAARLVGVSRFDERVEVKALPRVGGFVDPSVEAVLALAPHLVLVPPGPGNRAAVEKLAELGAPVLLVPLQDTQDVLAAMLEVGRALGRVEQARRLVAQLEATRREVRARARKLPPRKVLLVYGFQPLVVAGPGSFAHELLEDVGAQNVAAGMKAAYPVFSAESAVRARPDVVIDAVMGHESGGEQLRALPGLREARWVPISSQDLLHPGPAMGRALRTLFELVHGEAK